MCTHRPPCPLATAPDRDRAEIVVVQPEQGWSLLCNGIVAFDDTTLMLPDGRVVTRTANALTSGREAPNTGWLLPETSRLAT